MNKLDQQYTDLLKTILEHGIDKKDRTGTGTKSIFGYTIRHNMKDGFPLLTTKKMPFKTIVTELLWFLRGDTNIKYLVDNNCHIWDGDCFSHYLKKYEQDKTPGIVYYTDPLQYRPYTQEEFINKIKTDDEFAKKWGELGPIYGKQWRSWSSTEWGVSLTKEGGRAGYSRKNTDQIQNLINDLKTNPDSRRLMVNAWNVGELDQMVLPPCHYGFQVYTRELSHEERKEILYGRFRKGPIIVNEETYIECAPTDINFEFFNIPTRAISLMWNQRSVDTFLGLPFNIASYGLLLELIAEIVNMVPDQLIGNLGDVHLYSNHIEQAKEQIGRDLSYDERWDILKERNGSSLGLNHDRIEQEVNESTPARTREPFPLPKVTTNGEFWNPGTDNGCGMGAGTYTDDTDTLISSFELTDFQIENYQSHPVIKAPLSN